MVRNIHALKHSPKYLFYKRLTPACSKCTAFMLKHFFVSSNLLLQKIVEYYVK